MVFPRSTTGYLSQSTRSQRFLPLRCILALEWGKIAQALEVSLDYLAGNSDIELDKNTLDRVQEVTKLADKDRDHIYITLDALIRDFKNKKAYAH